MYIISVLTHDSELQKCILVGTETEESLKTH